MLSHKLRHRGPDWSGYEIVTTVDNRKHGIGHERLAIIYPNSGAQRIFSPDQKVTNPANYFKGVAPVFWQSAL